MTKLLDQAIVEVRRLPEARQDEAAEVLLSLAFQDPDAVRLAGDQLARNCGRLAASVPSIDNKGLALDQAKAA